MDVGASECEDQRYICTWTAGMGEDAPPALFVETIFSKSGSQKESLHLFQQLDFNTFFRFGAISVKNV